MSVSVNEARQRSMLANISDVIAIIGTDGINRYKSSNIERLFGWQPDELIGKSAFDIIHPEEQKYVRSIFNKLIIEPGQSRTGECRYLCKNGDYKWIEFTAINLTEEPAIGGILLNYHDITKRKKVELELQASEDQYRTMIENSNDLIWSLDLNGNFLFLNKIATNTTGLVMDEWIGKSFLPLIMEEDRPMILDIFQKGLDGVSCNYNLRFKKQEGNMLTISTNTSPIYKFGQVAGIVSFGRDITEKIEVEKRMKLLAYSLEGISECVSITDIKDYIIYTNEAFHTTYGYTENELKGRHISILRSPETKYDHLRDILPETLNGGWRGEITNRKKDGTLFPVLLSTSVIKDSDEEPIALIGVAIDISEIKKNREELVAARRKAEENNNLKSAFLTNMSHEIRTPMNAIVGFSDLMIDAGPEEKNAFAAIVQKSSKQLLELIENVIHLSRLQSEKLPINNISFCPANLLKDIYYRQIRSELKEGIDISLSIPEEYKTLMVQADENKIRQIFSNLISNALKYTLEGTIEMGFAIHGKNLVFFVDDTGIGISEHEQHQIFDNFYRGEKAISMAIGGVGLGLSISKELVRLLGGKINVKSTPGQGSHFSFTMPVEHSDKVQTESSEPKPVQKELKELVVLVADDEPANIYYFDTLLQNKVKKIDHACNGKEVIELVANNDYSIILMDLKMPVMSGIEATKLLKQQFPDLPIIAQTAYSLPEERENALQAGCNDFISKPINKEKLFEMILKYV